VGADMSHSENYPRRMNNKPGAKFAASNRVKYQQKIDAAQEKLKKDYEINENNEINERYVAFSFISLFCS
jgi:hypothetical protein